MGLIVMFKFKGRKSKFGTILYNHIINNKRGYLVVTILFFVGLMIGVFLINNIEDAQIEEINVYLNEMINNVKTYQTIDLFSLFKQAIISNFLIVVLLWFGASTIIGIPVVYGTVIVKGFTIGYTISSLLNCFEIGKGITITLSLLLLHNIIFIPTMLATSVSGVKMYQSIMKNKERENIKIEIIRHTIFCLFMLILMLLAALVEIYGSTNIFIFLVKNI